MEINNCRVCGLYIVNAPWGVDNHTPTYEICPCCGVEFGYEDFSIESVIKYRSDWIKNGTIWFMKKQKPLEWNLELQLKDIPTEWK